LMAHRTLRLLPATSLCVTICEWRIARGAPAHEDCAIFLEILIRPPYSGLLQP
jgi:hypothetical protein